MLPRTVRSSLAQVLLVMALLAAATPATAAEPWPSAPIRMIVPFAPGGSNDVIARYMSQYLAKSLGQSVVVENRAGGGSTIGAQALAASPPDGYTYMFVSGSLATSAAVQKTPYDPIKAFDAVINPPQGMILAVGAGEKRPYIVDDALGIATVMSVTGSFDHRAIDGADGAQLMQALKALVESPLGMVA